VRLLRVYPNGDRRPWVYPSAEFSREYRDVEDWKNYNMVFRPGCALLVDGKCIYKGCCSEGLLRKAAAQESWVLNGTIRSDVGNG
jgi:hypothetical protein